MPNGNGSGKYAWVKYLVLALGIVYAAGQYSQDVQHNTEAIEELREIIQQQMDDRYFGSQAVRDWERQAKVDAAQDARIERLIQAIEEHRKEHNR